MLKASQCLGSRSTLQRVSGFKRPAFRCRSLVVDKPTSVAAIIDTDDERKLAVLKAKFEAMDTDGNGRIDRDELRRLLESTENMDSVMFAQHWLPEEELDRVLEQYDTNKNGTIEWEEFQQIVYDGLLLDGKLSEYEEAFNAVDSSGNGTIGATELAELFASLGNPVSYEQLVDIMQKYDRDESGQVEFNEFLLMFRDQLLDLKEVMQYMALRPKADKAASAAVIDHPEGDLPVIFSEQELDELHKQCAASGRALVVFNALTWCRPCKSMQRPAQKLAQQYKDSTMWVKVFGNANSQTKAIFKERLKVRSTPCFIVFNKDGQAIYTQTGANKTKLETGLREALQSNGNISLPEAVYPPTESPVAA